MSKSDYTIEYRDHWNTLHVLWVVFSLAQAFGGCHVLRSSRPSFARYARSCSFASRQKMTTPGHAKSTHSDYGSSGSRSQLWSFAFFPRALLEEAAA